MDAGILRALEVHGLPGHLQLAGVRDLGTGEALDERGFSGTVVADDRQNFTRVQVKADAVQADNPAEGLDEVPGLQDGLADLGLGRLEFCGGHDFTFRIHWSIDTARMMRTPTARVW